MTRPLGNTVEQDEIDALRNVFCERTSARAPSSLAAAGQGATYRGTCPDGHIVRTLASSINQGSDSRRRI